MSHWRSVAYVESPLQLLNVVEAHAYGILGPNCEVVVRDPNGTISPTTQSLKMAGLPVGLKLFGSKDTPQSVKHTAPKGDYVHVLGDPFSGQQQSGLLRRTRVSDVVIVDDGLNTLAAVEALATNKPLVRPGQVPSPARKALGLGMTHILRKVAFSGKLTVFTAMPPTQRLEQELGVVDAHVIFHQYPWLSDLPNQSPITEPHVIVGSGFVADGHINAADYIAWVARIAEQGKVRYFPHRRTPLAVRYQIGQLPGVTVSEETASVEIALRSLTDQQTVHMLPTTALITLTPLLHGRGVTILPAAVPDSWWTEATPVSLRDFLSRPLSLFESLI